MRCASRWQRAGARQLWPIGGKGPVPYFVEGVYRIVQHAFYCHGSCMRMCGEMEVRETSSDG